MAFTVEGRQPGASAVKNLQIEFPKPKIITQGYAGDALMNRMPISGLLHGIAQGSKGTAPKSWMGFAGIFPFDGFLEHGPRCFFCPFWQRAERESVVDWH